MLAVLFLSLAFVVAVRRRTPAPYTRERYSVRRLFQETGSGSVIVATGQAAWVVMYLLPGLLETLPWVIAVYASFAQVVVAMAMVMFSGLVDRNRQRAAKISGAVLLGAILGVAIVPAIVTNGAGFWIGFACFVAGEVSANFFITAIEGLISVQIGGVRAQLTGHVMKFAAVAAASVVVASLSGLFAALFGAWMGAIALGVAIVCTLGLIFRASFSTLTVRARPAP